MGKIFSQSHLSMRIHYIVVNWNVSRQQGALSAAELVSGNTPHCLQKKSRLGGGSPWSWEKAHLTSEAFPLSLIYVPFSQAATAKVPPKMSCQPPDEVNGSNALHRCCIGSILGQPYQTSHVASPVTTCFSRALCWAWRDVRPFQWQWGYRTASHIGNMDVRQIPTYLLHSHLGVLHLGELTQPPHPPWPLRLPSRG